MSASIAVFLIALPLSLGIALATGAPLQAGPVAAAVGGIVVGRIGGSPLQVSGPAAGLTVVTADLIQHYGWRTTCAITVLAGIAQLGLGCLRVARAAGSCTSSPRGADAVVTLDGSFMDHAAHETLQDWQSTHTARGGTVEVTGRRAGVRIAEPAALASGHPSDGSEGADASDAGCRCRPWTAWRNHQCERPRPLSGDAPRPNGTDGGKGADGTDGAAGGGPESADTGGHELMRGISAFQRNTAPLVRGELARPAREGQRPTQLFLTCADSRVVTSMITASGPGDLFVVRNVGNLVPPPGAESGDDSVAAAIEYAVEVLAVRSITVCGHSGCGAMQALLDTEPDGARTPLRRWLRHGRPSLERMGDGGGPSLRPAGRAPADTVEQLCLTNVVQQLEHLRAHESVARALEDGALELHGMYFHVGEAQAYLLSEREEEKVFGRVRSADLVT